MMMSIKPLWKYRIYFFTVSCILYLAEALERERERSTGIGIYWEFFSILEKTIFENIFIDFFFNILEIIFEN